MELTTVWALLLLVAVKYYVVRLPFVDKIIALKDDKFSHAAVSKVYFDSIGSCLNKLPKLPALAYVLLVLLLFVSLIYLFDRMFLICTGVIGETIFAALILVYCVESVSGKSKYKYSDNDLVTAHEKMFGIIFWFSLLGSAGAGLYWLFINKRHIEPDPALDSDLDPAPAPALDSEPDLGPALDSEPDLGPDLDPALASNSNSLIMDSDFMRNITKLHGFAAWLPARITGLIYALVGNFSTGFNCWLKSMQIITMPSSKCLLDCGKAALLTTVAAEDDIEHLVNRAFIVWIVFGILLGICAK